MTGNIVKVTNLNKAIKQCKLCQNSFFIMDSGHTVGENHSFMLRQLEKLKQNRDDYLIEKKLFVVYS